MVLKLDGLRKRFGRFTALDDVSLHVRKGDCYGFLGHNGAGKTTALRIALGLIPQDKGRVLVEGFDAHVHPREARVRQGGLIETPGFYGWMSGKRNLIQLAGMYGMNRGEAGKEADRLLEVVGLTEAAHRAAGGYSQGMRQRLGIAQALLGSPSIIVLDEPMNGLDPEGIEEFRRLIVRLVREQDRTVIFSSHQIHEVAGICNRVGILRQGKMVVEAKTSELLAAGDQRYVLRTGDNRATQILLEESGFEMETTAEGALSFDPSVHAPGDVAKEIVRRELELVELAPRPVSLEEIYLRFSRGEAAVNEEKPAKEITATAPKERIAPPRPVLKMVRTELKRIGSHYGPVLLLLLPALLALFSLLRQWASATGHLAEVERGELFSQSLVTGFEAAAVALATALPLAAFVLAGMASQSIAGEYARGTLRNLLLLPVGRGPLSLGKAGGMLSTAFLSYLSMVLIAAVGAAIAFDFTDVVEIMEIRTAEPWVIVEAQELWPAFWRMLPALFLPLAAYTALGFLAGSFARRSVSGLTLAAGAVVFLDLFRTVGRHFGFERYLLSAYLPSPLGDTSLAANLLDRIRAPNDPPGGYVDSAFWVPLAWLAACVVLSTLIVRRRSVP